MVIPKFQVLRAAPYGKEASAIEPCTVENSMKSDMIPSTSRQDSINEVVPMEVDEPNVSGNTPPKYRDLLAKKENLIEEKDKIIARFCCAPPEAKNYV
ncbi:uncharacterized protein LOC123321297 [Coccinella septempunctata]|uniref:uncharacterized protein LOC123321297 n=1 Tax=Coccinella septempunctata TaxID=41139 RepID=UPI001D05FC43|nr:uncharacterized protein LOC123321297 [Coccinella septempunctata]